MKVDGVGERFQQKPSVRRSASEGKFQPNALKMLMPQFDSQVPRMCAKLNLAKSNFLLVNANQNDWRLTDPGAEFGGGTLIK
jgi:hypothetical protein